MNKITIPVCDIHGATASPLSVEEPRCYVCDKLCNWIEVVPFEQLRKLEKAMLLAADKLETYGNDEPSEVAKFLRDYVEGVKVKT